MANEKRLIDANEALRMMRNSKADSPCTDIIRKGAWNVAHDCAISCVDACPTVEAVEVVHGRWVQKEFWPGGGTWRCSECGRQIMFMKGTPTTENMHYCPGCGADMRGTKEMKKEMKKEMRLIDANALLENLGEEPMVWSDGEAEIQERNDWQRFKACVEAQDTVDAVSRGVVDQIRWERDYAMKQLEEHGIPFGGIAPDVVKVVPCKDCKHLNVLNRKDLYAHCPKTNTVFLPFELDTRTHYCSLGERKDND